MAVVSVSLPDTLLGQMDGMIESRGFAGRSDLVRAALRDFLQREEPDVPADNRHATLTLTYPEESERKLADIRHDHSEIIHGMMHGHTEHACVDMFLLEGPGEKIRAFADALRSVRAALLVDTVFTDVREERVQA